MHDCDFTGGITCNVCGRILTAGPEAGEIAMIRLLEAMAKWPNFGQGHGVDPPRLTIEEQLDAICERVAQRKAA